MPQIITELTTLSPSPVNYILYHHKIGNNNYFSLKSKTNTLSHFTFKRLNEISINNVVFTTAEELLNAFSLEFNDYNEDGNAHRPAFTPFKFVQKGFANVNIDENEVGDVFCGWSNDGTIRISEAIYIGGDINNSNSFLPIVQTEILQ